MCDRLGESGLLLLQQPSQAGVNGSGRGARNILGLLIRLGVQEGLVQFLMNDCCISSDVFMLADNKIEYNITVQTFRRVSGMPSEPTSSRSNKKSSSLLIRGET